MNDTFKAFQDGYDDNFSHCYGCGRHNPQGHQLKSYWDGDTTVARFKPDTCYSGGVPNKVYGGLIASLLDCHGAASAAAAACRTAGLGPEGMAGMRFVTANLNVNYVAPTPMDVELEIRGEIVEIKPRKVTVDLTLSARGEVCATGRMIAVRLAEGSW